MPPRPVIVDPWTARPVKGRDVEGVPYWRARAQLDGVAYTRGRRGSRREIRAWLLSLGDPREQRAPTEVETVADLLEVWLGHVEASGLAERTTLSYRGACQRLVGVVGPYPVGQLLRGLAEDYVSRNRRRYAPATLRLDLRALSTAWSWARRRGLVVERDLRLPRVPGGPTRPRYTPSAGEVAAVVDYVEARHVAWYGAALRLLYALGCRVGELMGLRWSAVRLDEGVVELRGKTGARVVRAPAEAVAVLHQLAARRGESPYVLGVRPSSLSRCRDAATAAQVALGQRPWTLQALRRAKVDRLHRQGVDVASAAAYLGHSPAVVWSAYRQVSDADLVAVAVADDGHLPRGQVVAMAGTTDRNTPAPSAREPAPMAHRGGRGATPIASRDEPDS